MAGVASASLSLHVLCDPGRSSVMRLCLTRWRGKVAIVTGASAGIGWAVCEALAAAGMRVVRAHDMPVTAGSHVRGDLLLPAKFALISQAGAQIFNEIVCVSPGLQVGVARRRERLEALQQALVSAGVPVADFLPVVCDITKARSPCA